MADAPTPTVLTVLVSKDGARWLRGCLASLARQTHPRLGILAVDNASTDGSAEILQRLLGRRRVLRLQRNLGFPGAVARALRTPAALQADHLLLIHDDSVLAPTAVERMLETAEADGVGIVGAKVLDAEEPRVLRDVGGTIDRFGYPYSPLEEGEIDQGQYDSTREVLAVSSAAMLVSREAWSRAGPPDDRLRPSHADLDFCWRIRIAGFRVLLEPGAVVHHRAAGDKAERPGVRVERGRYFDERANLTGMLKNYRLLTLLWLLPLFLLQGLSKVALFLLLRRFTSAWQSLAGWGWALLRLPGTIRRRVRVQASRRLPDREVAKLMVPFSERLRRWSGQISGVLFPGRAAPALEDDESPHPLRARMGGLLADHPAAVTLVVGLIVGMVAFRDVLFASPLEGGAFPAFPESARDMLARFADGSVPGGFGGWGGASPAVGILGLGGIVTLGNPRILAWLLVAGAPFLAGMTTYRAVLGRTGDRMGAVVGGLCYALSAVVMWAVSEGRIEAIALLVGLPWVMNRLDHPFEEPVEEPLRWVVGTALGLGAVAAFSPIVWAPAGLVVLLAMVIGGPRGRRLSGTGLAVGAVVLAAVLILPLARELAGAGGGRAGELGSVTTFSAILRLSPAPAPGSWLPALFLPVAGVLGFAVAARRGRRSGWRTLLAGAVALPLAWLAGAGWLPDAAADPMAFLGLAAFSFSVLVGKALGGAVVSGRLAFGGRQLVFGAVALLVAVGVLLQISEAVRGEWGVGRDRISPAYPMVETAEPDVPFRVLWLGSVGGGSFPAPGGPPQGVVEARRASVRYGVTGRHGRSVLAIGLPAKGPGYEYLERGLQAMLAGRVQHGGSLLSPLGIAYVVAGAGDLSAEARQRLDVQLDLLPAREAGGLLVYRNARTIPMAAVLPNAPAFGAAASSEILAPAHVRRLGVRPLGRVGPWAWAGRADLDAPALVYLSSEFRPDWRLVADGQQREPFRAFGWAVGFEAPEGQVALLLVRPRGWERPVEVGALAALWFVGLWIALRRRTA